MEGRFEEVDGGSFRSLKLQSAWSLQVHMDGTVYGVIRGFLVFGHLSRVPAHPTTFRFNLSYTSPSRKRAFLHHTLLIGTNLGLVAMVAFTTTLVPTLIMTWITALVFEYLFGRGLLGHREGLVGLGSRIAKDISWLALKSKLKRGNGGAFVVLVLALLSYGLGDSINKYI